MTRVGRIVPDAFLRQAVAELSCVKALKDVPHTPFRRRLNLVHTVFLRRDPRSDFHFVGVHGLGVGGYCSRLAAVPRTCYNG